MKDKSTLPRIAFQGERGAFSEEAAVKLLGEGIELIPRPSFEALFASLDEDIADYILAPTENSLAGIVRPVYDYLLKRSLPIFSEVTISIQQSLIGCPGASFETIRTVESHPVALAQCKRFFADNPNIKPIAAEDTAGSVAQVVRCGDATRAAIAGARSAVLYGGIVLREHLEDRRENYTRFVLLGRPGSITY